MHSLPRLSSLQEFEQYCEQIAVGGLLPRPCEKYEQLYKDIEVVPRFPNLIGPKKEFYSKSALEYGIQHFSSMPFVHDCLSLQQYCKKSTSDSDLVSRVVEYNRPLIPPRKIELKGNVYQPPNTNQATRDDGPRFVDGRLYAKWDESKVPALQQMRGALRRALSGSLYWDIDMQNAQYTTVWNVIRLMNQRRRYFEEYLEHRESVIAGYMRRFPAFDRTFFKQNIFIATLNGQSLQQTYALLSIDEEQGDEYLRGLFWDCYHIRKSFMNSYLRDVRVQRTDL